MCVHIYRGTAGVLKTGAPRQAWLWQERGEFVPLRDTVNLDSVGGIAPRQDIWRVQAGSCNWWLGVRQCHSKQEI